MNRSSFRQRILAAAACVVLLVQATAAGPYVTEASGVRWNEVGGVRWNEVGGPVWSEAGGVRWNEVGGVRWNEVGGVLFSDSQGVRWNEVGGVRWNEVGALEFEIAPGGYDVGIELELLDLVSDLPDTSAVHVIVSYDAYPGQPDYDALAALGIVGGARFRQLPMLAVNATKDQIVQIAALPGVRSVFSNKTTSFLDDDSGAAIGLPDVAADPRLVSPAGAALTGDGVTIAVIDSGVDGTHPDVAFGANLTENVRLTGVLPAGPGYADPVYQEGIVNTDTILGHGTHVASVAAGTGAASNGLYAGVAPGASIVSLSAGDLLILHVLEAFDYVLDRADTLGIRVVNCSWGTQGWFDPDDPVNIATRLLWDAGIVVVFAAGNYGPAPDSLNPYAVAPWVIGVGSTDDDGALSEFSSRGIHEELLYHPTLTAPGETIVGARAGGLGAVGGIGGIGDPTGGQSVPPPHDQHYLVASGTSFAAPHVAGLVALMLEADPTLDPQTVRRVLQQTATPHLSRDRSEVGAGRLEAWAALTEAIDPGRGFGSHVPLWTDQRPYTVQHQAPVETSLTLPAGSVATLPVALAAGATAWDLSVAWGTVPGLADVDLRVVDAGGQEIAVSSTINGLGLFGRLDGIHLVGDLPTALTVEFFFKPGTGVLDQDLFVRHQAAVPVVTGYPDIDSLSDDDREVIVRAVGRNVMIGRGAGFEPQAAMTRGELARSLALAGGARQRIPASATFSDVSSGSPVFPYVESVAGSRSASGWMEPSGVNRFRSELTVRRIDFAVGLVRAGGRGAEAEARAGEALGTVDEHQVPDRLKGYLAVAFENGWLDPVVDGVGIRADPVGKVTRLDASRYLLRLVEVDTVPPAATSGAGRGLASRDGSVGKPIDRERPTPIAPQPKPDGDRRSR